MNARTLIVGNWKMNPATLDEAHMIARKTRAVAKTLAHTDIVMCPPFVFLGAVASSRNKSSVALGAQDVSVEESGAHTGEVGAGMIASVGVSYVIVGHSEKRSTGETGGDISKKLLRILEYGMHAILCVGEDKRDEGGAHYDMVHDQLKQALSDIPSTYAKRIVVAYEPVWAIGAQEPMNPKEICEMTIFVRKVFSDIFSQDSAMKAKVLYGGSVNFRNAKDIIEVGQVDGLLVGRESVNMPGFKELLKAVDIRN